MDLLITANKACSDYALANTLSTVHLVFTIICLFVPIMLIVNATVTMLRYLGKPPDQKEGHKRLTFQFIAAVVVFFLPMLTDVVMNFLPDDRFSIVACWNIADELKEKIEQTTYPTATGKRGALLNNLSGLANYADPTNKSSSSSGSSNPNVGSGKSKFGANVPVFKGNDKASQLLNGAMYYVGGKYILGGGHILPNGKLPLTMEEAYEKQGGVDCSSFVRLIYHQYAGIDTGGNTTSYDFRSVGTAVDSVKNAKPGDIICYSGHVAIYMGNGQIVHAAGGSPEPPMNRIIQGYPVDYMSIIAIRRLL